MDAHYAWTITAVGRQAIRKVTTAEELEDMMRILKLPRVALAQFVALAVDVFEHGTYTHNEGGNDEWSLRWMKIDGPG
ncbi:hypothetical protein [Rhizobium sp. Root482]|uniref:hypothetical protein n=1 Tax=Rhizobium sp. Root482 TaxID=1736543 RepID=UPI0006F44AAE|nr:hypothetical protein [Rhizobium sp. Root482]KQY26705.1 hypothetical protein ASD31_00385 [Rhizobium sp. Root482]